MKGDNLQRTCTVDRFCGSPTSSSASRRSFSRQNTLRTVFPESTHSCIYYVAVFFIAFSSRKSRLSGMGSKFLGSSSQKHVQLSVAFMQQHENSSTLFQRIASPTRLKLSASVYKMSIGAAYKSDCSGWWFMRRVIAARDDAEREVNAIDTSLSEEYEFSAAIFERVDMKK